MIALDSNVLIDLIGDDPQRADASDAALRQALSSGPVVVCEVVVAEIVAGLGRSDIVIEVMDDVGIELLPMEMRSAVRAGEMQRRYRHRRDAGTSLGHATRAVPDFLIGAHAMMQCNALITRDAGFFLDYFKGLKVIVPKAR
jgi:predicted nucleic acid-binding protein